MAWPLREEFFCGFPKSPIKVHVLLFVALLKYFYNYNVSFNLNIILGAKIFSTELVLNKDFSVTGSTGGRNLDAAYADTVFVDAAATLTALITFKAVKDELKEIRYIYIYVTAKFCTVEARIQVIYQIEKNSCYFLKF